MKKQILQEINEIKKNKNLPLLEKIADTDDLIIDLGLDSFDLAELTVRLEVIFDKDVFEEGLIRTVAEVIYRLQK